jgi:hypothetical protein
MDPSMTDQATNARDHARVFNAVFGDGLLPMRAKHPWITVLLEHYEPHRQVRSP